MGNLAGIFRGFFLTHRTKAQKFRGKFRSIFRKKIRGSKKKSFVQNSLCRRATLTLCLDMEVAKIATRASIYRSRLDESPSEPRLEARYPLRALEASYPFLVPLPSSLTKFCPAEKGDRFFTFSFSVSVSVSVSVSLSLSLSLFFFSFFLPSCFFFFAFFWFLVFVSFPLFVSSLLLCHETNKAQKSSAAR